MICQLPLSSAPKKIAARVRRAAMTVAAQAVPVLTVPHPVVPVVLWAAMPLRLTAATNLLKPVA
jgi:hypothetical protein